MTDPILDISGLSVRLVSSGEFVARKVDLSVARGEIVCVVGESGSGKSVTAFATMGLLPGALMPASGSIKLKGEELLSASVGRVRALRGARMAMIFQEPMTALNPVMTVGRQIAEVLEWHDTALSRQEIAAKVVAALREMKLPAPERLATRYPHQLSGGQRQRVMIAIALVLKPDLLIADEPTTALDVTTQKQILLLVQELATERRIGVLFITHDFGVVAEIADRVVVMQAGEVVESGTANQVLQEPRHPYTRKLIESVPRGFSKERERNINETILDVSALKVTYASGGLFTRGRAPPALDDASFVLQRGEILGIVGESGSGKSTLARSIARLIPPTAGSIRLHGVDIAKLGARRLRPLRRHIQIVFQDPYRSLDPRMKIGRSLTEGAVNFGMPLREALARVKELLSIVGMEESAIDRYPHEFSGGQRQRLCIARALVPQPDILIADEAVSALDVSVQAQVVKLLAELRDRLGLAIVFITHDLRVAGELCDRLLVMRSGRIVEQGSTAIIFGSPTSDYTKTLLASAPRLT